MRQTNNSDWRTNQHTYAHHCLSLTCARAQSVVTPCAKARNRTGSKWNREDIRCSRPVLLPCTLLDHLAFLLLPSSHFVERIWNAKKVKNLPPPSPLTIHIDVGCKPRCVNNFFSNLQDMHLNMITREEWFWSSIVVEINRYESIRIANWQRITDKKQVEVNLNKILIH